MAAICIADALPSGCRGSRGFAQPARATLPRRLWTADRLPGNRFLTVESYRGDDNRHSRDWHVRPSWLDQIERNFQGSA